MCLVCSRVVSVETVPAVVPEVSSSWVWDQEAGEGSQEVQGVGDLLGLQGDLGKVHCQLLGCSSG